MSDVDSDTDSGHEYASVAVARDYTAQPLKHDHEARPLWVCDDGAILLEAFSPVALLAQDFLVAIADPVSRPALIHEYQLTEHSLCAAVSVGLDTENIILALNRLSKVPLSKVVTDFIEKYTRAYGKVKLVLKNNRYFVESLHLDVLEKLSQDEVIREARVNGSTNFIVDTADTLQQKYAWNSLQQSSLTAIADIPLSSSSQTTQMQSSQEFAQFPEQQFQNSEKSQYPSKVTHSQELVNTDQLTEQQPLFFDEEDYFANINEDDMWDLNLDIDFDTEMVPVETTSQQNNIPSAGSTSEPTNPTESAIPQLFPDDDAEDPPQTTSYSFEIDASKTEDVRKRCSEINLPILSEYSFRIDTHNPNLTIDLKPTVKLREYQEKGLSKMFANGRARSGVIVLPCGAGKTLVGVAAACTVRKSCLVLCTSSVSVEQWAREFRFWTTAKENQVARFTSDIKEKFSDPAGILISTYTMVTFSGKRAYDAQKLMDFIQSREWGLLILDETHVVPAEMFKKVLTIVAAHCKLGLTATLVREDEKIANLNYLVGPKLFEANWMELAKNGHIANVMCAEVWCDMTPEFYREYMLQDSRKRQLLYVMNPKKIQACQYLIEYHETAGDKIIVFSDNVFALKHYATKLNKPYIYGGTGPAERMRILQQFRHNPALNTLFLSKVGDTSLDIPEATVLIQISSHYGSRRQEAQRLGRILRAKKHTGLDSEFNAYFYSLVSRDTEEMYYASKRQQFLVDQGYYFKIITQLQGQDVLPNLVYATKETQLELLNTVLVSGINNFEEELLVGMDELDRFLGGVVKGVGNMKSLSGGDSMAYMEVRRVEVPKKWKR